MLYSEFVTQKQTVDIPADLPKLIVDVQEFCNDDTLVVLPYDSPVDGSVGYIVFTEDENDSEKSFIMGRVFERKAIAVSVPTKEEFEKIFQEAYNADYPIQICDDPVKHLMGFIVTKRTTRVWYNIHL